MWLLFKLHSFQTDNRDGTFHFSKLQFLKIGHTWRLNFKTELLYITGTYLRIFIISDIIFITSYSSFHHFWHCFHFMVVILFLYTITQLDFIGSLLKLQILCFGIATKHIGLDMQDGLSVCRYVGLQKKIKHDICDIVRRRTMLYDVAEPCHTQNFQLG